MIDLFALAVSHGLMMLAAWRLLSRDDLDREDPAATATTDPLASAAAPVRPGRWKKG
jgi:hypothetical protein